jgi:hypothetical protein
VAAPDKAGILPDGAMLAAALADWASWIRQDYPAQFAAVAARRRAAAAPPDASQPLAPGEAP